jgi:ribA/ribD-fused uncharacterized protein
MSQEQINEIVIHTESMIKGFFGEYRWLSNFHDCPVIYEGLEYLNSEAAYQAAKTDDMYTKNRFQTMSGNESKKASKQLKLKSDWNQVKKQIMYDILRDKFTRNEDLRQKLILTGSKYLEETNYWADEWWGVFKGRGKNVLGELLMKIRNELKLEEEWI